MTDGVFSVQDYMKRRATLCFCPAYPAIKERIDYGQLGGVETTYSNKD